MRLRYRLTPKKMIRIASIPPAQEQVMMTSKLVSQLFPDHPNLHEHSVTKEPALTEHVPCPEQREASHTVQFSKAFVAPGVVVSVLLGHDEHAVLPTVWLNVPMGHSWHVCEKSAANDPGLQPSLTSCTFSVLTNFNG